MAKVTSTKKVNFGGHTVNMKGRHSKNKSSNQKNSKVYLKRYRGQGR
tara:strand:- start:403 stop:543 length:141 start_codon:yes stop_codon:yes gene_type:complete